MSNLKNQLIKLGSENSDLRKNIRPLIDYMERKSFQKESRIDSSATFEEVKRIWMDQVLNEIKSELSYPIKDRYRGTLKGEDFSISIRIEKGRPKADVYVEREGRKEEGMNPTVSARDAAEVVLDLFHELYEEF